MITEEYRQMQRELHKRADYGVASIAYAAYVKNTVDHFGITEILDYGAGKQRLRDALEALGLAVDYRAYDPGVDAISALPEPAQCVTCIDVLEHIEPDMLETVLDHIKSLAKEYVFLTVHTGPAAKVLPDGRNAHLIQESTIWWLPKLKQRWKKEQTMVGESGFVFVGRAL